MVQQNVVILGEDTHTPSHKARLRSSKMVYTSTGTRFSFEPRHDEWGKHGPRARGLVSHVHGRHVNGRRSVVSELS